MRSAASWKPLGKAALAGLAFMLVGAALQALFAPTLVLSCSRQQAGEPACRLELRVIFDRIPVRHQTLEGVRSSRVEEATFGGDGGSGGTTTSSREGATPYTLRIQTSTGDVRALLWGDFAELGQVRDQLAAFLKDPRKDSLRAVARAEAVWRHVAAGVFVFGALYWLYLPIQALTLRSQARAAGPGESA